MISELLLSKVGIFDVEPNRASAVKRLINGRDDAVWYLDDAGLTWASRNPQMACSMTSGFKRVMGANVERAIAVENGFDISKTPQHSISFALMRITQHALERWEERCAGDLPSLREFQQVTNNHSANKVLKHERPEGEFFIPVRAGALVGIHKSNPLFYETISEVKQRSFVGNYQWDKNKKRWVGEFPRTEVLSIMTTFLGWDELKRGGAYNSIDWWKVQLDIQNADTELTNMIYGE
jgi:hypothetical protein